MNNERTRHTLNQHPEPQQMSAFRLFFFYRRSGMPVRAALRRTIEALRRGY